MNYKITGGVVYFPDSSNGGFVLVVAIVVLLLLTIIGISATNLTTVELQIAGNDKVHKKTFYNSDAGTEVGMLMVEENVSCPVGFEASAAFDDDSAESSSYLAIQAIQVFDSKFALDEAIDDIPRSSLKSSTAPNSDLSEVPSNDYRSIKIPIDMTSVTTQEDDTLAHTNLAIFGRTELAVGSAIQMASGYDGKGKSAGASGAYIAYDIHSQHQGVLNSETILRVQWKHMIGQEGTCRY